MRRRLLDTHGFLVDPALAPSQNAALQLGVMPPWLYFSRPVNLAYHNLCSDTGKVAPNFRALLGLGLNFCLRTPYCSGPNDPDSERFRRDLHTRIFFAGSPPLPENRLFIRSNWHPPSENVPIEFRARVTHFILTAKKLFNRKRHPSNLLPNQRLALNTLRQNNELIIWKTDKNLGPAIIERDVYIQRALSDHLLDATTYRQLSDCEANGRINAVRLILESFIKEFFAPPFVGMDGPRRQSVATFLSRSISSVRDPFGYFYLLAKVHKTPWSTRPIISCSGSILQGLGRWVDGELQRICSHLPFALSGSFQLVNSFHSLNTVEAPLPPSTRFFTCDAVSMYTNIDTGHALFEIEEWLRYSNSGRLAAHDVNISALMKALNIVMTHNVFRFGDTNWIQHSGTAMGAPPAPMYATLYFAIREERIVPLFPELLFYRRFIDDGFGIWIPSPHSDSVTDTARFENFQQKFRRWGRLDWTFSLRSTSVDFLDVTISLTSDFRIETSLFEKALNLYLYLPPHSAHPPGVLMGLILGMVLRIHRLTLCPLQRQTALRNFYRRLRARGYLPQALNPIFERAVLRASQRIAPSDPGPLQPPPMFYHVPFHPCDPPSREIQRVFRRCLLEPSGEPRLPELRSASNQPFGAERLVVAYSRPRNLGNHLARRRLNPLGTPVSSFLASGRPPDGS